MADEIDLANDLIDTEVARALSRLRSRTSEEGATNCSECGDDIPLERQQLGFKFCVPCASESENVGYYSLNIECDMRYCCHASACHSRAE